MWVLNPNTERKTDLLAAYNHWANMHHKLLLDQTLYI
jgi:hypothetical protein